MFDPEDMKDLIEHVMKRKQEHQEGRKVTIGKISPKLLNKLRKFDAWSDRMLERLKITHDRLQNKMNDIARKTKFKVSRSQNAIWDEIYKELGIENGDAQNLSVNAVTGEVSQTMPKDEEQQQDDDFPSMLRGHLSRDDDNLIN